MLKKLFFINLLLIFLLPACGKSHHDSVILVGSTSVQPYADKLAEEFSDLPENRGKKVDVQGGGSSVGIKAAKEGTADIGMSSRELKPEELERENGKKLYTKEIARDGLAIIVHPDNPVEDLTVEQLRKIYTEEITSWETLGVTDWKERGWRDADIHISTREEGSGTRSAFEDMVMGGERITNRAIVQDSNGSIRQFVSDDKRAIGFISLGMVHGDGGQKPVKALMLDGVEANPDNVLNGSYSLSRPFLFVLSDGGGAAEPTGNTKVFIDYVLSEEGQDMLKKEGLIPISEENGR